MTPASLTDALAKVDTDTNALAVVVTALRGVISTSMSQADVDAVNVTLGNLATRLEGIAADPANPVPASPAVSFKRK